MEGVSEQSIIGISSGLALEGFIPYVNTISTFITRRCYEQNVLDLALHNLPVRLIGNGGGLVYSALGPTHQALDDISIMRIIPNMTVIAPCDEIEMEALIKETAILKGPAYIRIAKGDEPKLLNSQKVKIGKSIVFIDSSDAIIFSTGSITHKAMEVSRQIKSKYNINLGVVHFGTVKPLDHEIINYYSKKVKKIFTLEENFIAGGFGSSIIEYISKKNNSFLKKIHLFGLENKFVDKYGSHEELLDYTGLSVKKILKKIIKIL